MQNSEEYTNSVNQLALQARANSLRQQQALANNMSMGGQSQSRQPMLGGQDSMAGFNQNNYYPSYQMNAQGMQQENFQRGSPVKLRCKHWATKGQCRMGSDCGFMHSGTPGDMHMCRHWATKGSCKLGDNCQFAHIGPAGNMNLNQFIHEGGPAPKANVQKRCKHWSKGMCLVGARCAFAHTGAPGYS